MSSKRVLPNYLDRQTIIFYILQDTSLKFVQDYPPLERSSHSFSTRHFCCAPFLDSLRHLRLPSIGLILSSTHFIHSNNKYRSCCWKAAQISTDHCISLASKLSERRQHIFQVFSHTRNVEQNHSLTGKMYLCIKI